MSDKILTASGHPLFSAEGLALIEAVRDEILAQPRNLISESRRTHVHAVMERHYTPEEHEAQRKKYEEKIAALKTAGSTEAAARVEAKLAAHMKNAPVGQAGSNANQTAPMAAHTGALPGQKGSAQGKLADYFGAPNKQMPKHAGIVTKAAVVAGRVAKLIGQKFLGMGPPPAKFHNTENIDFAGWRSGESTDLPDSKPGQVHLDQKGSLYVVKNRRAYYPDLQKLGLSYDPKQKQLHGEGGATLVVADPEDDGFHAKEGVQRGHWISGEQTSEQDTPDGVIHLDSATNRNYAVYKGRRLYLDPRKVNLTKTGSSVKDDQGNAYKILPSKGGGTFHLGNQQPAAPAAPAGPPKGWHTNPPPLPPAMHAARGETLKKSIETAAAARKAPLENLIGAEENHNAARSNLEAKQKAFSASDTALKKSPKNNKLWSARKKAEKDLAAATDAADEHKALHNAAANELKPFNDAWVNAQKALQQHMQSPTEDIDKTKHADTPAGEIHNDNGDFYTVKNGRKTHADLDELGLYHDPATNELKSHDGNPPLKVTAPQDDQFYDKEGVQRGHLTSGEKTTEPETKPGVVHKDSGTNRLFTVKNGRRLYIDPSKAGWKRDPADKNVWKGKDGNKNVVAMPPHGQPEPSKIVPGSVQPQPQAPAQAGAMGPLQPAHPAHIAAAHAALAAAHPAPTAATGGPAASTAGTSASVSPQTSASASLSVADQHRKHVDGQINAWAKKLAGQKGGKMLPDEYHENVAYQKAVLEHPDVIASVQGGKIKIHGVKKDGQWIGTVPPQDKAGAEKHVDDILHDPKRRAEAIKQVHKGGIPLAPSLTHDPDALKAYQADPNINIQKGSGGAYNIVGFKHPEKKGNPWVGTAKPSPSLTFPMSADTPEKPAPAHVPAAAPAPASTVEPLKKPFKSTESHMQDVANHTTAANVDANVDHFANPYGATDSEMEQEHGKNWREHAKAELENRVATKESAKTAEMPVKPSPDKTAEMPVKQKPDKTAEMPVKPSPDKTAEMPAQPTTAPTPAEIRASKIAAGEAARKAGSVNPIGGAGAAIAGNMHDMLWDKLQKGDTKEGGKESALLQAAKAIHTRNPLTTEPQWSNLAKQVSPADTEPQWSNLAKQGPKQVSPAATGAPAKKFSKSAPAPRADKKDALSYWHKTQMLTHLKKLQKAGKPFRPLALDPKLNDAGVSKLIQNPQLNVEKNPKTGAYEIHGAQLGSGRWMGKAPGENRVHKDKATEVDIAPSDVAYDEAPEFPAGAPPAEAPKTPGEMKMRGGKLWRADRAGKKWVETPTYLPKARAAAPVNSPDSAEKPQEKTPSPIVQQRAKEQSHAEHESKRLMNHQNYVHALHQQRKPAFAENFYHYDSDGNVTGERYAKVHGLSDDSAYLAMKADNLKQYALNAAQKGIEIPGVRVDADAGTADIPRSVAQNFDVDEKGQILGYKGQPLEKAGLPAHNIADPGTYKPRPNRKLPQPLENLIPVRTDNDPDKTPLPTKAPVIPEPSAKPLLAVPAGDREDETPAKPSFPPHPKDITGQTRIPKPPPIPADATPAGGTPVGPSDKGATPGEERDWGGQVWKWDGKAWEFERMADKKQEPKKESLDEAFFHELGVRRPVSIENPPEVVKPVVPELPLEKGVSRLLVLSGLEEVSHFKDRDPAAHAHLCKQYGDDYADKYKAIKNHEALGAAVSSVEQQLANFHSSLETAFGGARKLGKKHRAKSKA